MTFSMDEIKRSEVIPKLKSIQFTGKLAGAKFKNSGILIYYLERRGLFRFGLDMKSQHNIAPWLYHLHHLHHDEDIPFWLDLANHLKGPILELGCGTGRVFVPLVAAGYRPVGLDVDLERLKYLQDRLEPRVKSFTALFQGNLAAYHISQKFGLIFLACNTMSMLPIETRQSAFSRIYSHLASHGRFAASLPNPLLLAGLAETGAEEVEEVFSHPITTNPIQVSSEWRRVDQSIIIFRWYYDHLLPDGRVERSSIESEHFITSINEIQDELLASGLTIEEAYGDFDQSPYNAESPHLIILVRKVG